MNAPSLPLALGFTLGVWLLQQMPALPALWPMCLLALASTLGGLRVGGWWRRSALLLAALGVGFVWAAWRAEGMLQARLDPGLEGQDLVVEGRVDAMPQLIEYGQSFPFRVLSAPAGVPPRLQLAWYRSAATPATPALRAGQRWRLTLRLKQAHGSLNPHTADREAALFAAGIAATGYVRVPQQARLVAEFEGGPRLWVERLREAVRERFARALPQSPWRPVLVALAVGDQQGVTAEQWRLFGRSGITHLVSISGLHVLVWASLCAAAVAALWRRWPSAALRWPTQHAAAVAGLLAATAYSALAGWGVPAQRTVLMLAVLVLSRLCAREPGAVASLALALLAVLVFDPWAVLGRGFWLSFGAVGVLLFAVDAGFARQAAWRSWLRAQWALSLGLLVPLLVLTGQVSLVSPLANAIAIPVVTLLILPLVLAFVVLPWAWLAEGADWLFDLLAALLQSLATPPWAVWQPGQVALPLAAAALLGCLLCLLPRGVPGRLAGLALLLPLFFYAPPRPPPGQFEFTVLDVGQGLAVHLRTATHDLLFDSGPRYGRFADAGQRIVLPYLRGEGVSRLDAFVLSHADADHAGGADSVLAALPVDAVMGALPASHPIRQRGLPFRPCRRGESWVWDGVRFSVLHPALGTEIGREANRSSCVLRVEQREHALLLTADIEQRAEAELLAAGQLAPATVVLAPHHGSRSSSSAAFVAATRPHYVVFAVGYRSRFGHPHAEVLARYAAHGASVLRSDRDGALRFRLGPQGLEVTRWRQSAQRYWHARWPSQPAGEGAAAPDLVPPP